MTCVQGAIDDIYFVRWLAPDAGDVEPILDGVTRLRQMIGKPIRYIGIIGPEVEAPGEEARAAMRKANDDLLQHCATVHLVVGGKGFRRAMLRSVGTSIFLLSKYRGRVFAHDSVEHALDRIGIVGSQAAGVMEQARAQNLMSPAE